MGQRYEVQRGIHDTAGGRKRISLLAHKVTFAVDSNIALESARPLWTFTCVACHEGAVERNPFAAFPYDKLLCESCFETKHREEYQEAIDGVAEIHPVALPHGPEYSGVQMLLIAVIERAARDLVQRDSEYSIMLDYHHRLDAWRWFHGRNGADLTFIACCEGLALDPEATRGAIIRLMIRQRGIAGINWPYWIENGSDWRPAAYEYDQGPTLNRLLGDESISRKEMSMAENGKLIIQRSAGPKRSGMKISFMLSGEHAVKLRQLLLDTGQAMPELCETLLAYALDHVELKSEDEECAT